MPMKKPVILWLLPLCLVACDLLEPSWSHVAEGCRISLQGFLDAADSVHRIYVSYAWPDGAAGASDRDLDVRINGFRVEVTGPDRDYVSSAAPYVFCAGLREGDRVRVSTGDAFVETVVPPPPDTLSVTVADTVAGKDGVLCARFSVRVGPGLYRMELSPLKRWYTSWGLYLRREEQEGVSGYFSVDAESGVHSLEIPWQQLGDKGSVRDAARMEVRVAVRIRSLSRDRFAWYDAWASARNGGLFGSMEDFVRFPGNVEGGFGLVDVAGSAERTFLMGSFDY